MTHYPKHKPTLQVKVLHFIATKKVVDRKMLAQEMDLSRWSRYSVIRHLINRELIVKEYISTELANKRYGLPIRKRNLRYAVFKLCQSKYARSKIPQLLQEVEDAYATKMGSA